MKGFQVEIYSYRDADAFSPMRHARKVTIIDPAVPAMYEPTEDAPAVRIVRRNLFGREYIHAEPYAPGTYSAGGRFIYSCDSRFREINNYPISLHDRNMDLEGGKR